MRIYEVDYTRCVDEVGEEYVAFSLETSDTLDQVVYAMAELFDKSPTFRGLMQEAFKTYGLKLEKGTM